MPEAMGKLVKPNYASAFRRDSFKNASGILRESRGTRDQPESRDYAGPEKAI